MGSTRGWLSFLEKIVCRTRMSNSTPVKNGLIPAGVQDYECLFVCLFVCFEDPTAWGKPHELMSVVR